VNYFMKLSRDMRDGNEQNNGKMGRAGIQANIRNGYLPSTALERHRHASFLDTEKQKSQCRTVAVKTSMTIIFVINSIRYIFT
jgi:hypothetical protein